MHVTEGHMPYLGFSTYWRMVEPDAGCAVPGRAPLVLLHGGPGSGHDYFEVLDCLADLDGRMLVMYDQLGCGGSWDEAMHGRSDLWTYETWVRELALLREHLGLGECHLLGQSWGGMLALEYVLGCPSGTGTPRAEGVRSLVLSSTLSSCALWGEEQHRQMRYLPADEQEAIAEGERTGDYDAPAFRSAQAHYMELFCSGPVGPDSPECLRREKRGGREAYLATQGDNEFTPTGIFATWDVTGLLGEVTQPALVISGTDDLCSPRVAKTLADGIPGARWELMPDCRHMCFVDDTPRYLQVLTAWLDAQD